MEDEDLKKLEEYAKEFLDAEHEADKLTATYKLIGALRLYFEIRGSFNTSAILDCCPNLTLWLHQR